MKKLRGLLTDDGLFYLSVPSANDTLVWNAHRIYGSIRWPLLIAGWEVVDTIWDGGHVNLTTILLHVGYMQPTVVLRKKVN